MGASALTIVMPLKGRHLHTLRFLWHANLCRLPWPILVADGQVHPTVARLLEDKSTFPNLTIDYVRYPDDASFAHYWRKMADAVGRVRTPYVAIADNDDFLMPQGVARCIAFLDDHPDYVCCGGGIGGFELHTPRGAYLPSVLGRVNMLRFRHRPRDESMDIANGTALDRAIAGLPTTWIYYAVTRTEMAAAFWRDVEQFNFSETHLIEYFQSMRYLVAGKAKSDRTHISYMRQYRTSLGGFFLGKDWAHHLLNSRYMLGFEAVVDRISTLAAAADSADRATVEKRLREACADFMLRPFLIKEFGPRSAMVRLKYKLTEDRPFLGTWLKLARHTLRDERAGIRRRLAAEGADEAYLVAFDQELKAIDATVADGGFAQFLRRTSPDLIADAN